LITGSTVSIAGRTDEEIKKETREVGLTLSPVEWRGLAERIGRDPTLAEAILLDVSLSEHCSYKSSRPLLKKFLPPMADHVILGPGEDAGIVSVGEWNGEEWALVLAHESHNHPSQVLPVEGAATGIGGIVRDVYCMGCDVTGVLDPLRFGDPDGENAERTRAIVRGVVEGISQYGNALGVPNLGGDLFFHEGFDDNCLVNVVAFGLMKRKHIIRSRVPEAARSEHYHLVLVGKPTDSTGLGGASFASQILDEEEAAENRGAVQVHDPFLKRVLVEGMKEFWQEVEDHGWLVGCKDLGAAGLGGASSELVLAAGFGAEIDLDKVPTGEPGLLPHQILCGETQERFVWAVPEAAVSTLLEVFNDRYELDKVYPEARAAIIGRVLPEPSYRCRWQGETVVDLTGSLLEDSPIAERERAKRPEPAPISDPPSPSDWGAWLKSGLTGWNAVSRAPIFRCYDQEVRGQAFARPGEADAGICRPIPNTSMGLAISVDGNPDYGALDPYWAGALSVLESVRNVVAVGATPIAITDCLNFGNPENPVALGELSDALHGMSDACKAVGSPEKPDQPLPIVSGNVSLYNQSSRGQSIPPSPIVACFGILPDYSRSITQFVRNAGNRVLLIGTRERHWGRPNKGVGGRVPNTSLLLQVEEIRLVSEWIEAGVVRSCHDIADGGLVRSAFEMLVHEDGPIGRGLEIDLDVCDPTAPAHEILLSETPGFLLEVESKDVDRCIEACPSGLSVVPLGTVTDRPYLEVSQDRQVLFDAELGPIHKPWSERIRNLLLGERSEQ